MKTITKITKAWISPGNLIGPKDLRDPNNVDKLTFHHDPAFSKYGYTLVGDAEITVTMVDEKALVTNKVEALRNELAAVRAEAQMKATQIESRINDLLALTYEPEAQ